MSLALAPGQGAESYKGQTAKLQQWRDRMDSMVPLSDWLAQTGLSLALTETTWAVPLLQSIHILSVAVVFSSVMMLDLQLAGIVGRQQPLRSNVLRFYPWIWCGLVVLIITGFFQIMAEPARELLNWIFWTKMTLVVAAALVTGPVRSRIEDIRFADMAPGKRHLIRATALVSLLLWVSVIICGRWIAYAGGPAG